MLIKSLNTFSAAAVFTLLTSFSQNVHADTQVTLNDFYRPFELSEITPQNMQTWPYYRYTSMNWDDYGLFGTVTILAAREPAKLVSAQKGFDIEQDLGDGRKLVESLTATQTKGFLILKNNEVLAEFYDNGFTQNQTQLLQSSSKTYAGIVVSTLIDEGKIDPAATIDSYLPDFKDSKLGKATVQQVLDMQSGLLPATDYHVPGGEAFMFEAEQGLKLGETVGHRNAIITTKAQNAPGEVYTYNDKNTDLLAILAEAVSGQHFNKLLSSMFNDFGATSNGSIALTVDGTASPSYGISSSLRDYGLFHQWIAQGKAPKSFYDSVHDTKKDLLAKSEKGKGMAAGLGTLVTYGSQGWYLPEHKIIVSIGSYGQVGFSDMKSGVSVVFMQDWEDNGVAEKLAQNLTNALFVIEKLSQN
ncbi:serine hydrolase domain-containing protein [Photobacterium sanguinicancri]|uniref:Serine hydrolase n=1 Tax=Photobacterium sanguinicancri TaxID=875932 RepID=A0AAW7Y7V9_9GAMM|nr:serine hydrolase [Photobacterium sanguinicancri]MDO6544718.1 serine hydrolase [Photobacterium sanguinicancri]